jgi:hypothetical protein
MSKLHPQQDQMLTGMLTKNEDPRTMMYGNVSSYFCPLGSNFSVIIETEKIKALESNFK